MRFSCTETEKAGFVDHVYKGTRCRSTKSLVIVGAGIFIGELPSRRFALASRSALFDRRQPAITVRVDL
jgi:hypothetical protein